MLKNLRFKFHITPGVLSGGRIKELL